MRDLPKAAAQRYHPKGARRSDRFATLGYSLQLAKSKFTKRLLVQDAGSKGEFVLPPPNPLPSSLLLLVDSFINLN